LKRLLEALRYLEAKKPYVAHPLKKKGAETLKMFFFFGGGMNNLKIFRYSVLMWFTRVYYPDNSEVALKNEFTNK